MDGKYMHAKCDTRHEDNHVGPEWETKELVGAWVMMGVLDSWWQLRTFLGAGVHESIFVKKEPKVDGS